LETELHYGQLLQLYIAVNGERQENNKEEDSEKDSIISHSNQEEDD